MIIRKLIFYWISFFLFYQNMNRNLLLNILVFNIEWVYGTTVRSRLIYHPLLNEYCTVLFFFCTTLIVCWFFFLSSCLLASFCRQHLTGKKGGSIASGLIRGLQSQTTWGSSLLGAPVKVNAFVFHFPLLLIGSIKVIREVNELLMGLTDIIHIISHVNVSCQYYIEKTTY